MCVHVCIASENRHGASGGRLGACEMTYSSSSGARSRGRCPGASSQPLLPPSILERSAAQAPSCVFPLNVVTTGSILARTYYACLFFPLLLFPPSSSFSSSSSITSYRACVCVCVCVRACVRACVRVRVRVCVCDSGRGCPRLALSLTFSGPPCAELPRPWRTTGCLRSCMRDDDQVGIACACACATQGEAWST